MATTRGVKGSTSTHPDQPRASNSIKDNQCIPVLQGKLLAGSSPIPRQTMNFVKLNLNCHVAKPVHTAPGKENLNYVKSALCVTQLSCV